MRSLGPEIAAHLKSGVTTICRCWRITRRDGVVQGFTDHDREVVFQGQKYAPESGFDASGIEAGIGLAVDNSEITGALSSEHLSEDAIVAGRYDGAAVDLFAVNWSDPGLGYQLFKGSFGEIRRGTLGFEAELRSLSEPMNRTIGRTYLPTCDRELGDAKCGVDLGAASYGVASVVAAVEENRVITVEGLASLDEGWFHHGLVHWSSGANLGLETRIKRDHRRDDTRRIELWSAAPLEVAVGDLIRLVVGCDKTANTCREKFDNILNFRGFPHIPGEDFVTAYPARGGGHTGGSRNG